MKSVSYGLASALALIAVTSGPVRADVLLSGPDANAGLYSTATLSTLAGATTVASGGFTGISLWNLLGGANASSSSSPTYGAITTSTPSGSNGKNAILRYYLLGTGAGGQQSIVSLGEIDPYFAGSAATPAFVAFQATGGGLLSAPELIVPGAPARDLSGLTNLQLLSVPALPTGTSGQSAAVQLSGAVTNPGSYTLSALQSTFTPMTLPVTGDTYTGVPLWTFLNPSDSNITSQIVITQATDGYEVVLSLAELDPNMGGNPNDLLAYADTGTSFPNAGIARTIFPTDSAHGRWQSNLSAVSVSDVPEPASLSLVALAVAGMAATRRDMARRSGNERRLIPA